MKSWKTAIESMGFLRWRYEKLQHLHCMAFRKIELDEKEDCLIGEANADMLYIPQDYNDGDSQRENFYTDFSQPLFDEENIRQDLEQLPDFVDLWKIVILWTVIFFNEMAVVEIIVYHHFGCIINFFSHIDI